MYGVRFMLFALYHQVKTPMSFGVSKAHNLVSPYLCKLNDQSPPPHFICLSLGFSIYPCTPLMHMVYTHYVTTEMWIYIDKILKIMYAGSLA
jgi:hypothetical protein